jgi:radical SAM protein with 4Fe4S-binding SPASM domain
MKFIIKNLNALKYGVIWRLPQIRDYFHKKDFNKRFVNYKKSTPCFRSINIETTNMCTKRCSFCYFGNVEHLPSKNLMPKDMFEKIIKELVDMDFKGRISLYEINEPLIDPRIFEFIEYVRKELPDCFQMIQTNGDLLNEETLNILFESGLDKLIINAYNNKNLLKIKKLLSNYNYNGKNIVMYDKTKKYVHKMYTSRAGNIDQYKKKVKKNYCELVYVQMIVKSNGDVVSCVNDMWSKQIIGNLNENTVPEIWFGNKFEQLRRELDLGNRSCSALCNQCDYVGAGGYLKQTKR